MVLVGSNVEPKGQLMSKKIQIIVTDYIEANLDWEMKELETESVKFTPLQLKHVPVDELIHKIKSADVLIVNMAKMSRDVLSQLPKCKLIIRHGAGYDNIDVVAAESLGIGVSYVPDYCTEEVAEQAQLLLMTIWRRYNTQLEVMRDSVAQGQWQFNPVRPIRRMAGNVVGLIGCGRIGSISLKMLRGLGFQVLVCDPYLSEARKSELNIETLTLSELLPQVDVVTLHCSLTPETYHMISTEAFALMRENAILINTARGGVVDSEALAKAIQTATIAGAGIDVYEQEPPKPDFSLIGLNGVTLTPHLSWYSEDAEWSIRTKIVEDVNRFLQGMPPRFPVNETAKSAAWGKGDKS